MRHVVIVGGTGLVGRELQAALKGRPEVRVTVLVRTPGKVVPAPNIEERVFNFGSDYAAIGTPALPCDVLLCAVGSTMGQAGSKAAFLKVERDIPVALVHRLKAMGRGTFGFVSSTGAGKPFGFYLENKAAVEQAIKDSGVASVIVRPSLLLGTRSEFRLGERLAMATAVPLMKGLMAVTGRKVAALGRMEPVPASQVARKVIHWTLDKELKGMVILEGFELTG